MQKLSPNIFLNTDLKLFTKIIASRLQQHLPHLIHLDKLALSHPGKPGTTPSKSQTYCTQLIVTRHHVYFIRTDAEKAFDRVSWKFIFTTLKHIGLGNKMLNWVSTAYSEPTARANGVLSDTFSIINGTRQGCPLLPLLFTLSLESFLCHVRLNPDIIGITVVKLQYKVSAYADDLMFSLTKPAISLPNLMWEFDTYG